MLKVVFKTVIFLISAPCDQPIEQGPCSGSFERWGFDKERDACVPFNYGGCKATKNNFPTENACNYHCKKPGIGKSEYLDIFRLILEFVKYGLINCHIFMLSCFGTNLSQFFCKKMHF